MPIQRGFGQPRRAWTRACLVAERIEKDASRGAWLLTSVAAARSVRSRVAVVLPLAPVAAVPVVFLHRMNQLHVAFGPIDVYSSDVAIAIVVGASGLAGVWWGWAPLRPARALWLVAGALLVLFVSSCFWSPADQTRTHLITASKYIEYALLAPALVLLLRRRVDVERLFLVFVGWSAIASAWGLLQFVGLFNEFRGKNPDQREPSFIGIEDLAALSGAVLVIALVGVVLGDRRRRVPVAGISGAVGVAVAASWLAFLRSLSLAAIAIAALGWRSGTRNGRRGLLVAAIVLVVGAGIYGLRADDTSSFLSFLKTGKAGAPVSAGVQTGSQRVLLAYIGLRIWEDHPLLGVGFERSFDHYHSRTWPRPSALEFLRSSKQVRTPSRRPNTSGVFKTSGCSSSRTSAPSASRSP